MEGPYRNKIYNQKNKSTESMLRSPFFLTSAQAERILQVYGVNNKGIQLILLPLGKKAQIPSDWLMRELGYEDDSRDSI